jgi:hypothetical protein
VCNCLIQFLLAMVLSIVERVFISAQRVSEHTLRSYLYNTYQQDALIIFSFIPINNVYMFRATLLPIIRRYYAVVGIYSIVPPDDGQ